MSTRTNIDETPKLRRLLDRIGELKAAGHKPMTLLAVCPNSPAVIKAAFRAAKRNNAPILFAATLNQVDCDGGYTGMTQEDFVRVMKVEAARNHYTGPFLACIDHGGPWLKDIQTLEMWPYEKAMEGVKRSYEAALLAGYELIHVDPTVDRFLPKGKIIDIEVVAARTIELITHIENFRKERGLAPIAYEVGTEEVHGGLADMSVFNKFLGLNAFQGVHFRDGGQGFVADVVVELLNGGIGFFVLFDDEFDAVGDLEAAGLAEVLHAVYDFAGEAFLHQFIGDGHV